MPVAADSGALTLLDYAMQSNDPLQERITLSLLGEQSILNDLPLTTNEQLKASGTRIKGDGLPTTNWGKINEAPAIVKTKTQAYEEQVALVREMFQIDRRLLAQKNWIEDPIEVQVRGAMEAHRYDINTAFFLNDPSSVVAPNDEDAWWGLRARLDSPTKFGIESEMKINGGGVDLTTAMTSATANNFLELIGQMLSYMGADDGTGCVLYMNWLMKERFARAIRVAGTGAGFRTDKDNYDRMVEKFRNAKIVNIGRRRDQTSLIITNTETAAGVEGASTFTSIYGVRYGEGYFKGWQTNALKPENLGRSTESGTYNNVLIDWGCGLWQPHSRAVSRAFNIKVA